MTKLGAPLKGVTVVDLTTVFLGPYCTMLMAEMGARVIKVEPIDGDPVRRIGAARHPGMSATFLSTNRGKESLCINLKTPDGLSALKRVLMRADVLVHNMRPSSLERLGLKHSQLASEFPRLIHCSAYGFGERGPYAGRPAYDDIIQSLSGLVDLQSLGKDQPEYVTTIIADKTVALRALSAILAGLFERERVGHGQEIVVPMYETMAAFALVEQLNGHGFVPPIGDEYYSRTISKHRRPFATRDGYLSLMLYSDKNWTDFFRLAGRPDLAVDSRITDLELRTEHIDDLYAQVANLVRERSTKEWLLDLTKLDIPCAPVLSVLDVIRDEHLAQVGLFVVEEHPTEGQVLAMRPTVEFGGSAGVLPRPAPSLGEHSESVLYEAGLAKQEVKSLAARGIITQCEAVPANEAKGR